MTITVHGADQLTNKEVAGKNDPFCELWLKKEKFKTAVIKNAGSECKWNQSFIFNLKAYSLSDIFHMHVYDKDLMSKDSIGRVDLKLEALLQKRAASPMKLMLVDKDNFKKMAGFIYVTCKYDGTGAPAATPVVAAAAAPAPQAQPGQVAAVAAPVQPVARPVMAVQPVQSFQPVAAPVAAVAAPAYTQPVARAGYPGAYVQPVRQVQPVQQVQRVGPFIQGRAVFLQSCCGQNLRVMPDGSVNGTGGRGALAQFFVRHANPQTSQVTLQNAQGKWLRITPNGVLDGNGAQNGPYTYFQVVLKGNSQASLKACNGAPGYVGILPNGQAKAPSATGPGPHGTFTVMA
jgi:hypothetical protein